MKTLTAHGRIAYLCDQGFKDWRLNIDAKSERLITSQPDWPAYGAAMAELSGGMEDLADDCLDNELLDLVRHGVYCYKTGILTEPMVVEARNAVVREVMKFGDSYEQHLHHTVENN